MRSRRDQVQAHAYMVGRLTCALMHAEPDAPETPMRRTRVGWFAGLMIGAIGVAVCLVVGLIFPSGKGGGLSSGDLLVSSQTGGRYIYLGKSLRPVLNWASALLLLNGQPQVDTVSQTALGKVPQGPPLGIVGAPDSLPAAAAVSRSAWLACATAGPGAGAGPVVTLAIGASLAATSLPGHDAVLVAAAGTSYLLWQGTRLRIDAPWIPDALGLGGAQAISVNPTWLNAVPAGPDLRPLGLPGVGSPGPAIGGQATRVGEVLDVRNVASPAEFYLVEAGGVTPVSQTQAALELTDPGTAAAYPGASPGPVVVSSAAIAGVPAGHAALPDRTGVPASPPAAATPASPQAPCIYYPAGPAPAARLVFAVPPSGSPPAIGALGVTSTAEVADQITVLPGMGALVRPQAAPGVAGDSLFLVTGLGVKFPVPSAKAAAALGYSAATARSLPAALLGLLPTGPSLDLAPLSGAGQGVIAASTS
jgi:type VII secretion protein EccB